MASAKVKWPSADGIDRDLLDLSKGDYRPDRISATGGLSVRPKRRRPGLYLRMHQFGFAHLAPSPIHSTRVLVVDDEEDILLAARILLRHHFPSVDTLTDPTAVPGRVRRNAFDVLLLCATNLAPERLADENVLRQDLLSSG